MATSSELAKLYVAIFKAHPRQHSLETLVAMEQVLGLQQDDPLARMLIVLLRTADQIEGAYAERTETERGFLQSLALLRDEVEHRIERLWKAPQKASWWDVRPSRLAVQVHVTRRLTFPVLAYLAEAFQFRTTVPEQNERIWAARLDLTVIATVQLAVVGATAAIVRFAM